MSRETKLSLVVGFSLVLVVCILVADHFSTARQSQPGSGMSLLAASNAGSEEPVRFPIATELVNMGTYNIGHDDLANQEPSFPPPNISEASGDYPVAPIYPAPGPLDSPINGGTTVLPPTPIDPHGNIDQTQQGQADEINMSGINPNSHNEIPPTLKPWVDPVGNKPEQRTDLDPVINKPVIIIKPVEGSSNPKPTSPGKIEKHTIRNGDSLYQICKSHYGDGNLWTKLKDFNKDKISSSSSLRIGTTLSLPPKDVLEGKAVLPGEAQPAKPSSSSKQTTATPTPSPKNTPSPVARPKTYTVQKGDVLSVIAQKTLGSSKRLQDLIDANHDVIDDPDNVAVGTVLKIPSK